MEDPTVHSNASAACLSAFSSRPIYHCLVLFHSLNSLSKNIFKDVMHAENSTMVQYIFMHRSSILIHFYLEESEGIVNIKIAGRGSHIIYIEDVPYVDASSKMGANDNL